MTKERVAELRELYSRTVDANWGGMATGTAVELSNVHDALEESLDAIDNLKKAMEIARWWNDMEFFHDNVDLNAFQKDMARIRELVGE